MLFSNVYPSANSLSKGKMQQFPLFSLSLSLRFSHIEHIYYNNWPTVEWTELNSFSCSSTYGFFTPLSTRGMQSKQFFPGKLANQPRSKPAWKTHSRNFIYNLDIYFVQIFLFSLFIIVGFVFFCFSCYFLVLFLT